MKRAFLVFMLFSAIATAAPSPSPTPQPRHRMTEFDQGKGDGRTLSERHPWLGRVENFLSTSLFVVFSLFGGGRR